MLGFVVAGVGVALWPDNSSKQVLPDGTVLVLSGLEIGRATAYTQVTSLAKMLGGFVPSNGVSVGRFKLQRARTVRGPAAEGPSLLNNEFAAQ